jgi:hypothetical protein
MQVAGTTNENLTYTLNIRVYGRAIDCTESHSYIVGDTFSDISSPIGKLCLNIRKMTLKQVRPMIEYDKSGFIDRRSMMFQEALFLMEKLPNYFHRPKDECKEYRLGFVKKDLQTWRMINKEDEEKPISELFGTVEFFEYDLLIIPLTQIDPSFSS